MVSISTMEALKLAPGTMGAYAFEVKGQVSTRAYPLKVPPMNSQVGWVVLRISST